MTSASIRSKKPDRKAPVPKQQPTGPPAPKSHAIPLSPCEDPHILIAKRGGAGDSQSDPARLMVSIRLTAQ